ncbi:MAG: formylglycine-generating enzyme family protein, partial [Hydrogenophaga sp.]|nr:formylglycine-generating enzyme family protein [Hydrogenophaga sp.]
LLSEAEWEYAARAGTTSRYAWGEDTRNDQQCRHANGADRVAKARVPGASGWTTADCEDGHAYTAPVGSFQANRWGLHDMSGNVWEWVQDVWHDSYQGAPTDGSAWMAGGDQGQRVLRGGSWINRPQGLRSADRLRSTPGNRDERTGFRLARTVF